MKTTNSKRLWSGIGTMIYKKIEDDRGYFMELFRKSDDSFCVEQVSLCHINPGQERGGHFHTRFGEIFLVIDGEMTLVLENVKTGVVSKAVLNKKTGYYRIRPYEKHSVIAVDSACTFVILANKEFDPNDADTFIK